MKSISIDWFGLEVWRQRYRVENKGWTSIFDVKKYVLDSKFRFCLHAKIQFLILLSELKVEFGLTEISCAIVTTDDDFNLLPYNNIIKDTISKIFMSHLIN